MSSCSQVARRAADAHYRRLVNHRADQLGDPSYLLDAPYRQTAEELAAPQKKIWASFIGCDILNSARGVQLSKYSDEPNGSDWR
jgi:hypothetical protein